VSEIVNYQSNDEDYNTQQHKTENTGNVVKKDNFQNPRSRSLYPPGLFKDFCGLKCFINYHTVSHKSTDLN